MVISSPRGTTLDNLYEALRRGCTREADHQGTLVVLFGWHAKRRRCASHAALGKRKAESILSLSDSYIVLIPQFFP